MPGAEEQWCRGAEEQWCRRAELSRSRSAGMEAVTPLPLCSFAALLVRSSSLPSLCTSSPPLLFPSGPLPLRSSALFPCTRFLTSPPRLCLPMIFSR